MSHDPKRYSAVIFDVLTGLIDSWTLWNAVAGDPETGTRWRQHYLQLTYGVGDYQPYEELVVQAAVDKELQPDFTWKMDARSRLIEISAGIGDLIGISHKDLLGRTWINISDLYGIDFGGTIDNLIDPHSVFMRREERPKPASEQTKRSRSDVTRFPAKGYMDRYINPPHLLKSDRAELDRQEEEKKTRFPARPMRDIMLFLLHNAPLEDWESDILSMIREESYYFAPQGQTKILNEGWASYWHSTIMTRYVLQADELIEIGRASCRERV